MELPFEQTVCRCWKQKLYDLLNREETQEIRLPDSMPDIGHVIASWGQVVLRGKDWRGSSVGMNGGVMTWVIYAPEGGGPIRRIESWIPFQARADLPESGEDGVIRVEPVLRSVDARHTSARKLMVRVGIGLLVQVMAPESVAVSQPGELPEDLEGLVNSYPVMLTREAGERGFLLDEELTTAAGSPPAEQLIYFRLTPQLQEQKVMGTKGVFRGQGNLHVLYMDREQQLCATDLEIPFAQYMELDGEYDDGAKLNTVFAVTSLELDITESGALRLKCGITGQYLVCAPTVVTVMEDAYSPCREVETERELLTLPVWLDGRSQTVTLSQSLDGGGQVVDHVLLADLPVINRQSGGVSIECGGSFQALLLEPDGGYTGRTLRTKEDFSQDTACETVCFTQSCGASVCRREGSGWRLEGRVELDVGSLCSQKLDAVTALRLGELSTPDPERPSLIIRPAREGQSLWSLARSCGSTVGAIRRLNRLEGEPEPGKLLLIPVL